MRQRVALIAGPTASGKTEAAIRLAEELGGVVVNADSMQVYRDLSILSARPGAEEQARVPHHLFGHVDAGERYSVGRWLGDVAPILKASARRGVAVVVVGGTGLYFTALTQGLSDMPDVPDRTLARWDRALKAEGPWALHAVLMARDRETADSLEPGDGQRIVRALALNEATGKSVQTLLQQGGTSLLSPRDIIARRVLMPPREKLYARINARFAAMVEAGALDEVRSLAARRLDPDLPAMKAIGVRELMAHLAGETTLDQAIEAAQTQSRRYAKRQMTWVRGQMADWDIETG